MEDGKSPEQNAASSRNTEQNLSDAVDKLRDQENSGNQGLNGTDSEHQPHRVNMPIEDLSARNEIRRRFDEDRANTLVELNTDSRKLLKMAAEMITTPQQMEAFRQGVRDSIESRRRTEDKALEILEGADGETIQAHLFIAEHVAEYLSKEVQNLQGEEKRERYTSQRWEAPARDSAAKYERTLSDEDVRRMENTSQNPRSVEAPARDAGVKYGENRGAAKEPTSGELQGDTDDSSNQEDTQSNSGQTPPSA